MTLLQRFWRDEDGVILSMETVLLGTIGVLGLTTGLSFLAAAVNAELEDLGSAIRGVDQGYQIQGAKNCAGQTAGSSYQQMAVQETLLDLRTGVCQPSISGDAGGAGDVAGSGGVLGEELEIEVELEVDRPARGEREAEEFLDQLRSNQWREDPGAERERELMDHIERQLDRHDEPLDRRDERAGGESFVPQRRGHLEEHRGQRGPSEGPERSERPGKRKSAPRYERRLDDLKDL